MVDYNDTQCPICGSGMQATVSLSMSYGVDGWEFVFPADASDTRFYCAEDHDMNPTSDIARELFDMVNSAIEEGV